ncbi:MAG TPA: hypothetical protein VFD71_20455 [Planctomycetota bacterium]|nr:hypothetical protein [Planctomycetota bacterium]
MRSMDRIPVLPHSLRRLLPFFVVPCIFLAAGCGSKDGSSDESNSGDSSADEGSSGSSSAVKAPPLTEKRLQAYIAYRKELHLAQKNFFADWTKVAKSASESTTDVGKAITATTGYTKVGQKQEAIVAALRKKHGFGEEEDDRLWNAASAVVSAKAFDNPALDPSLKMYREMQAKGGEEKKAADEFFKSLEESQQEGLKQARDEYGAETVDLLSRHTEELRAIQMDAAQKVLEGATEAK